MRFHVTIAIGLVFSVAAVANGQSTRGQKPAQYAFPFNNVRTATAPSYDAQPAYDAQPDGSFEEGHVEGGYYPYPEGFSGPTDGCYGDGCSECGQSYCDCGSDCGYDYGYDCGGGCGGSCGGSCGWWPGCGVFFGSSCGDPIPSCFCVSVDYLYVRGNASQATAYILQETDESSGSDEFHEFDFEHESSFRLRGSCRLSGCDEELRFTYTRLSSEAEEEIPFAEGILVPFGVDPPPDGLTLASAEIYAHAYDIEFAKTIPLGGLGGAGDCGCGCGGGCGGDCCGGDCGCGTCAPCCPAWDITWSGGLRFADVDWRRSFVALEADESIDSEATTAMNFEGGGVRVGLEGRRYLGRCGVFSAFLRGDLSLLLGNLDLRTDVRETDIPVDTTNVQTRRIRTVIPVTEIEGGITAQLTCCSRLSAGYMLSAWHDLGIQDQEGCNDTLLGENYDDANILGFDGMFIRLERCF